MISLMVEMYYKGINKIFQLQQNALQRMIVRTTQIHVHLENANVARMINAHLMKHVILGNALVTNGQF